MLVFGYLVLVINKFNFYLSFLILFGFIFRRSYRGVLGIGSYFLSFFKLGKVGFLGVGFLVKCLIFFFGKVCG